MSDYSKDKQDKYQEYYGGGGKNAGSSSSFRNTVFGTASRLLTNIRDLPSYVKSMSDIGIDFSLMGKKTRVGIPRRRDKYDDDDLLASLGKDKGNVEIERDVTPYFNRKYEERIRFLNVFSTHPEIEYITHQVCDEMIVYDNQGYFCDIDLSRVSMKEEYKSKISKNFKKMYSLLGFDDGITAWAYALQWIIEGYVLFEVLYDDLENPQHIVGFSELAPNSVVPMKVEQKYERKDGSVGKRKIRIWKQVEENDDGVIQERTLQDNQVIAIAYNRIPGQFGRISYVERLVRSFNLMRTMENTKVGWHIMNSQFRLKMVVPVGNKTTAKAKQSLKMISNKYKEDLLIDHDSGEVTVNGQAKINFGRNIVLPQRRGSSPDIDGISYNGPNLSNMDGVKYFEKKLWRDSVLPYSRFDREGGAGRTVLFNADGIPHDVLSFHKFIGRLRKEFEKILKEATYRQTIMDMPELKLDLSLKSKIGIEYESNSMIEEAKEQEIETQKLNQLSKYERQTELDQRTPIYSRKFLYVHKFKLMTEEEWEENRQMRDEELEELEGDDGGGRGRF